MIQTSIHLNLASFKYTPLRLLVLTLWFLRLDRQRSILSTSTLHVGCREMFGKYLECYWMLFKYEFVTKFGQIHLKVKSLNMISSSKMRHEIHEESMVQWDFQGPPSMGVFFGKPSHKFTIPFGISKSLGASYRLHRISQVTSTALAEHVSLPVRSIDEAGGLVVYGMGDLRPFLGDLVKSGVVLPWWNTSAFFCAPAFSKISTVHS